MWNLALSVSAGLSAVRPQAGSAVNTPTVVGSGKVPSRPWEAVCINRIICPVPVQAGGRDLCAANNKCAVHGY